MRTTRYSDNSPHYISPDYWYILPQRHFDTLNFATVAFRHNDILPQWHFATLNFATVAFCHSCISPQLHFATATICHSYIAPQLQFATVTIRHITFRHNDILPQWHFATLNFATVAFRHSCISPQLHCTTATVRHSYNLSHFCCRYIRTGQMHVQRLDRSQAVQDRCSTGRM